MRWIHSGIPLGHCSIAPNSGQGTEDTAEPHGRVSLRTSHVWPTVALLHLSQFPSSFFQNTPVPKQINTIKTICSLQPSPRSSVSLGSGLLAKASLHLAGSFSLLLVGFETWSVLVTAEGRNW